MLRAGIESALWSIGVVAHVFLSARVDIVLFAVMENALNGPTFRTRSPFSLPPPNAHSNASVANAPAAALHAFRPRRRVAMTHDSRSRSRSRACVGNDPRRSRARDDRHDSRGGRDDDAARIHRKICANDANDARRSRRRARRSRRRAATAERVDSSVARARDVDGRVRARV